ncbi:MAG TPA: hypothetical protein VGI79_20850 [Caulobacteraceae bacterium]|jgi:hypothetical protein
MAPTQFAPKANPTNKDLQGQVEQLHDCLHQVGAKVETQAVQMAVLAHAMGVQLPTRDEIAAGMVPRKVSRRLGGLAPWQALCAGVAAMSGAQALYKIMEPAVVAAAIAMHQALMGGH